MATPHVAGLVALISEQNAGWGYQQVISHTLDTARTVSSRQGKTVAGSIINAQAALGGSQSPPPPPNPDPVAPAAPDSLQASVNTSNGLVTLTWNDNLDNESGFDIQRQKYNTKRKRWVSTTTVSTAGVDNTEHSDSPGNGTFRYRVRSGNAAGTSEWTACVSIVVTTSGGGGTGGGSGKPCRGKKC